MSEHFDAYRRGAHQPSGGSMPFSVTPGQSHDLFRSLYDSIARASHDAIVTVDQQQRIVMLNPAAQRMFGCTANEALGTSLSRFIPPEHRAAHAEQVRAFDLSGTAERPMAERGAIVGLRSNGERFPAEATISRLDVAGELGEMRYFTALMRDISATQSLNAEVNAIKSRMLEIFELAPVAIWITEDDCIMFANDACKPLFGAGERESLVGQSIYALLHPESHEPVRQAIKVALESNTPRAKLRERISRPDGDIRLVDIALAPLSRGGKSALQMVITDVTEEARMAVDLKGSREQLRRLAANLVATREEERLRIAHELHEGLAQQLAAMQMELSSLGPALTREGASRLETLLAIAAGALSSVRRIASELHPLMLEELGLRAAIESLVNDSRQFLGIEITLAMDPVDDLVVNGAGISIYRMVQEALSNIARHSRATRVGVDIRLGAEQLKLVVRDNGTGFPSSSMHRPGAHGLIGIDERAAMFGGSLEIDAVPGGGSRITVTLPLDAISASPDTGDGKWTAP